MPAPSILDDYVTDIAFAADEKPAESTSEFITQLVTAASNLSDAGITGTEDLETAATYLAGAMDSEGAERSQLLARGVRYLKNAADMVDEYREMV